MQNCYRLRWPGIETEGVASSPVLVDVMFVRCVAVALRG